jgi:DNA-binding response OmpR family regulator
MYVPVFPATPSPALTSALIGAGYQPVPIDDLKALETRKPVEGWTAAIVEAVEDLGRAVAVAQKLKSEHGLAVLLVVDRMATEMITGESGFADFILSPIDKTELQVRMSRLGAGPGDSADTDVLHFSDLELNTATYQATVAGEPRDLTFMEYELLRFFVENPGRVWSREQILSRVWGYDYFGGSRTVDVHVRRLRAKLGEERSSWITTVRSVGYRFG